MLRLIKSLEPIITSNTPPELVLILNSNETDELQLKLAEYTWLTWVSIDAKNFDHGGTRNQALQYVTSTLVFFMTQDIIIKNISTLVKLKQCFLNPHVATAFGRQLPHSNATVLAQHLRAFNYPDTSYTRFLDDRTKYGIKTCFNSNSFAAYRTTALKEVGGFHEELILGEDMYATAKLLLNGYAVTYCAESEVYHSHNYTLKQEFQRYFDIGVFHSREAWLIKHFGKPTGEGLRYIRQEWTWLKKHSKKTKLFEMLSRISIKFLGYKLGCLHKRLPLFISKQFSMHSNWWKKH